MPNPTLNVYKTSIELVPFEGSLVIFDTALTSPIKLRPISSQKITKNRKMFAECSKKHGDTGRKP